MDGRDISRIDDLTPDDANLNRGTERGPGVIEESLQRLGCGRSILSDKNGKIIAGNNVLQKAAELGFDIEVVHTNGTKLVVVIRDDLDLDSDDAARELSIADNRASELGLDWRSDLLTEIRMKRKNIKLKYMFTDAELANLSSKSLKKSILNRDEGRSVVCPKCKTEFIA